MKIKHLSSDVVGGAARAANRLHRALVASGTDSSEMLVSKKVVDDWRVEAVEGKSRLGTSGLHRLLDAAPRRLMRSGDSVPRSLAWTGVLGSRRVNQIDADVLNLHWICAGFLSIETIGKIRKPLVWTLHDMWAFCGAEHLAPDNQDARWLRGYDRANRDPAQTGLDIDAATWRRKRHNWRTPMSMVAPSEWLAGCVRSSALMHGWDVTVIPNTLDVERFKPAPKRLAREILGLPADRKLVLFGAIGGTKSPHKGWDLLSPALQKVAAVDPHVQGIVFGQGEPRTAPNLGMRIHWMGHLHDDATLALLYSAADVLVVPSRQEAFGQTGSEAQACGCPVVAFNATGLIDVVEHGISGYLATPYSSDDLAAGIQWVLEDDDRHRSLTANARARAVARWSHEVVAAQYREVYRKAIDTAGLGARQMSS